MSTVAGRMDPNDAGGVVVAPTAAGRALLNPVRNRSTVMLAEVLATFSAEDRERLAELMERLVAALDDRRSPAG